MTKFSEGDIVRTKSSGREWEIEDINPNENYIADEETYAEGFSSWGTETANSPDDIELVMAAKDAAARTLPDVDKIAAEVASSLHGGWGDVVRVSETAVEGGGRISVVGRTADGLDVEYTVTVSNVFGSSW